MFYVNLLMILIGNLRNSLCVIIGFPCAVNLQLHAEVPFAFPVKNRLRLVIVVMDHSVVCVAAVTGVAAGIVVILVDVVGVVLVDRPAAVGAGSIVAVITPPAKRRFAVPLVVVIPYPCSAPFADHGLCTQTFGTKQHIPKLHQFRYRMLYAADIADSCPFQCCYLQNKDSPELLRSRLHEDNIQLKFRQISTHMH